MIACDSGCVTPQSSESVEAHSDPSNKTKLPKDSAKQLTKSTEVPRGAQTEDEVRRPGAQSVTMELPSCHGPPAVSAISRGTPSSCKNEKNVVTVDFC